MSNDTITELTSAALDRLADLLDAGHSESLTAMLATMGRFHRYSWSNVCLIAQQRPTATHVAGFHAWRRVGRWVRKGEKGIAILAPVVARQGPEASCDDKPVLTGFRTAYVFDVEQTEGTPLPSVAEPTGEPGEMLGALRTAIQSKGIVLETIPSLSGALGVSKGGIIQVLDSLTPAGEFVTLAHEFAHELLHRTTERPTSRDSRELEAEAVAYVVGSAVGVDTSDASRDYIHLYRGDRDALAASLTRIHAAASLILRALDLAPRAGCVTADGASRDECLAR